MIWKFITEIWKVPTCSWTQMEEFNWETWMSLRWLRGLCCILRREPLTMLLRRSGKTSLTITSPTFGHLAVFFTRWPLWNRTCYDVKLKAYSPFRAEDMEGLYKKVIKGSYPKIPSAYSQDLSNMIRAML